MICKHTFNFAILGLLVQTLWITLFTLRNACINKDLDKWERRVVLRMKLTGKVAIRFVGRDERRNRDRR